MTSPQVRRISGELTPAEQERLSRNRELIAAELPDLIKRNQMAKEASDEATLSGELRRAVHAGGVSVTQLAERIGISATALDGFLTGERTLRSDVLDRLAATVGYVLQPSQERQTGLNP